MRSGMVAAAKLKCKYNRNHKERDYFFFCFFSKIIFQKLISANFIEIQSSKSGYIIITTKKKAFSSQLHKENNFATVVSPVPWSPIERVNLLKSIKTSSESKPSVIGPKYLIRNFAILSSNCNILTWGIKKNLLCITPPASSTKSSPHKNIPLTVAQHFPERRGTLSCMYKNILLTAAQDFMAQYRLFCKHTTHKNTIELFSNIETCFTIFLPFVVHSLIIIFYKGLNFVYFPVI